MLFSIWKVLVPVVACARGVSEEGDKAAPLPHTSRVRVFAAGDRGVTCFRIPSIIRTTGGVLIAFAEARHGSCKDGSVLEIMARRSFDGGRTWGKLTVVAGSSIDKVGNPQPIAMSSGRVVLLYANHRFGDHAQSATGISIVTSDDDGESWSRGRRVSDGFADGAFSLPGPGPGIEITLPTHLRSKENSSKRLLAVTHGGGSSPRAYILLSDDGAESWRQLNHTFRGLSEGALADLGDGHVFLALRSRLEDKLGRPFSRSTDGGLTWTRTSYDKSLVGPGCHAGVASIGKSVYFSNPASSKARENLTIRKSSDGGRTWESRLLLQDKPSWGYSSLVAGVVRDSLHGGILYEASHPLWRARGNIDFALFPLDLGVPRPDLHPEKSHSERVSHGGRRSPWDFLVVGGPDGAELRSRAGISRLWGMSRWVALLLVPLVVCRLFWWHSHRAVLTKPNSESESSSSSPEGTDSGPDAVVNLLG